LFFLKQALFGSVETGMNRFGSHKNHKNRTLYDGLPPRTSPRHGCQEFFLNFLVSDPPRGAPSGVASFIVPDG